SRYILVERMALLQENNSLSINVSMYTISCIIKAQVTAQLRQVKARNRSGGVLATKNYCLRPRGARSISWTKYYLVVKYNGFYSPLGCVVCHYGLEHQ